MRTTSIIIGIVTLIGIVIPAGTGAIWAGAGPGVADDAVPQAGPVDLAQPDAGTGPAPSESRDVGFELWQSAAIRGQVSWTDVVDADGDGTEEIAVLYYDWNLARLTLHLYDGVTHARDWASPGQRGYFLWATASQIDADAAVEIVVLWSSFDDGLRYVTVLDGAARSETAIGPGTPYWDSSIPVVADLDLDGTAEIVFVEYDPLWVDTGNGSGGNGSNSSGYWSWGNQTSTIRDAGAGTLEWESPIIADWYGFLVGNVDGDPRAEISIFNGTKGGGGGNGSNSSGSGNVFIYDGGTHALQATVARARAPDRD